MTQAARSTKQNIIEGYSDVQTSFETEIKLLGVARGSNQELLADYQDYRGFGHSCGSQRPQNMRTIPIVVAPACGNTIAHLFPLGRAGDNRNGPRCSEHPESLQVARFHGLRFDDEAIVYKEIASELLVKGRAHVGDCHTFLSLYRVPCNFQRLFEAFHIDGLQNSRSKVPVHCELCD